MSTKIDLKIIVSLMKPYLAIDTYREWMEKPFSIGDDIYATNTYAIIKIPKRIIKQDVVFREEIDKSETILSMFKKTNINLSLDVDDLDNLLKTIPKIDDYEELNESGECSECDGCGEVVWEYNGHTKDFDCPECDGEGTVPESKRTLTGNKITDPQYKINILSSNYNNNTISGIMESCKILDKKTICLKKMIKFYPLVFLN